MAFLQGETLKPDPARDEALRSVIRHFLDGQIDREQLDAALREIARHFETQPYRIGPSASFENLQPDQRLFEYLQVVSAITNPALQAYWTGDITADVVVLKVAPFFLVWGAWGFAAPLDASPDWQQRTEALAQKIAEFVRPS